MPSRILIVSTMQHAGRCAALVADQLGVETEVAPSRLAALTALRSTNFTVVIVEEALIETDPEWADLLWESAGLAIPIQLNFAISASARLVREVKAAMARHHQELAIARRAATSAIHDELKSDVTGLLLESELALREPGIPAPIAAKISHLVELARHLRTSLTPSAA